MRLLAPLRARARASGLHGRAHVDRQRLTALLLICTGLLRCTVWIVLLGLYLLHIAFPDVAGFTAALFANVAFVACLSLYANAATDWGQVCASLAQLTAGDAHHDAEAARREVSVDFSALELDVARLSQLQPGPEGDRLAAEIRERLRS